MKTTLSPHNQVLPMELVTEVLARLPVKSLLRFKCVSKQFYSLISSPQFASLHFAAFHDDEDDDNTHVLASTYHAHANEFGWTIRSSCTFMKITSSIIADEENFKAPEGYHPRGTSVYGLLLLCNFAYAQDLWDNSTPKNMMLWNPLIGKPVNLTPLDVARTHEVCLGLGFNPSGNYYKVVAIAREPQTSVHVFTLNTHSWRRIDNIEESVIKQVVSDGVPIGGEIYWSTYKYQNIDAHLASFDLEDELFNYTMLPSEIGENYVSKRPVAYRDLIGVLAVFESVCQLWVMEKYHKRTLWAKLYTVDLQGPAHILCFKQNGHLMFATEKHGLKWSYIESQKVEHRRKAESLRASYGLLSSLSHWSRRGWNRSFCTHFKESLMLPP